MAPRRYQNRRELLDWFIEVANDVTQAKSFDACRSNCRELIWSFEFVQDDLKRPLLTSGETFSQLRFTVGMKLGLNPSPGMFMLLFDTLQFGALFRSQVTDGPNGGVHLNVTTIERAIYFNFDRQ